ncbi:hypothetical protein [Legionella sp. PC997]|uniref:hypothetical protein n=1 Tax=Legionella sp. PC997 TaxID=2755562 RepID=UPI0015FB6461|nr:hypothetical protein [Legionella sp. PC997]
MKKELKFTKSLKVNDMHLFLKNEMPLGALYADPEKKPSGPKVLKINTTWKKNTKQIQLLANKQRRIQHDKLLKKLLLLIETLLEQPTVFRYLDHLEKFSVKLPNNLTRFINFFNLLEEIRFAIQDATIETKTATWFAMNLDGPSLKDDLFLEEIRYFPERISGLIEKFFTTLVIEEKLNKDVLTAKFNEIFSKAPPNNEHIFHNINQSVLDAAKELFLQQVKEDLIALRNSIDHSFDSSTFKQERFLSINSSPDKLTPCNTSASKLHDEKFSDLFGMLRAMEFSNLKGIVIHDFSDFQNKSKLTQLLFFIEKNQQTLQKVTILKGGTSEDIVSFRSKLESFSNITLNIEESPASQPQSEKKGFKFFKRPIFRHDESKAHSVGSRFSQSNS